MPEKMGLRRQQDVMSATADVLIRNAADGAVKAAGKIGVDTAQAIEAASTGAIEAAEEISIDTAEAVREVLSTTVRGKEAHARL
jgi:hypothetical protein